jgi:uncharacterized membrane protein
MNRIRNIRRLACILTGLAIAALASAAPALAMPAPPPDGGGPATVPHTPVIIRTLVSGGMAGWQITLIAAAAAVVAATLAVLAYRSLAPRRRAAASVT